MKVIAHQHVGMDPHPVSVNPFFEQFYEMKPIVIVLENAPSLRPARHRVVPSTPLLVAQRPAHDGIIRFRVKDVKCKMQRLDPFFPLKPSPACRAAARSRSST
jgi:hypothetical protein